MTGDAVNHQTELQRELTPLHMANNVHERPIISSLSTGGPRQVTTMTDRRPSSDIFPTRQTDHIPLSQRPASVAAAARSIYDRPRKYEKRRTFLSNISVQINDEPGVDSDEETDINLRDSFNTDEEEDDVASDPPPEVDESLQNRGPYNTYHCQDSQPNPSSSKKMVNRARPSIKRSQSDVIDSRWLSPHRIRKPIPDFQAGFRFERAVSAFGIKPREISSFLARDALSFGDQILCMLLWC